MGTQLPHRKGHSSPPPTFQPTSIVAKRSPISAAVELLFKSVTVWCIYNQECSGNYVSRSGMQRPSILKHPVHKSLMLSEKATGHKPLKCLTLANDIDSVKVLCPTQHKIGHSGDVLPSQSLGLVLKKLNLTQQKHTTQKQTRMWANAQRDGRPEKHRWRPLFNAAKFGWCPLLECRAVTLLRRETRWKLQWCPKLANRSQALVGWSSPYCTDMWGRYCCLTGIFCNCRYVP